MNEHVIRFSLFEGTVEEERCVELECLRAEVEHKQKKIETEDDDNA